jgi:hypothetical protein
VFFIYGFLVHGILSAKEYTPYPEGVYRPGNAARSHMPVGLPGIFMAIPSTSARSKSAGNSR